ncbi:MULTISPECIES: VOC family protein [unclassified Mesorhizobium]|uniref:VOC family protein n=1 Tax=unclassified Mesorhizobium TaxID=325217 RepID=UPI001126393C|nr:MULTISPECIES: VOC family protein [unclassified Mesorhizobium]TPK43947.1 drug:proton antiporter [Mesorhizobium sp. B2-5-2]TPL14242.1 drug:proton antiporter [Mesorhizobium sp. B2-4-9]TPL26448.1 drug:proton antiporter [Mesorhizobium sp. B2-4-7]TPL37512.1 drug:proton antiporter [Mesorhizobium sp. B2-4-5]TPM73032.1 drug:proton antiporter [Mesorhizobium sp. B2-1-6]
MVTPNFVILYVDQPQRSGAFYSALLGREPVESAPTFVLFVLDNGFKLGLWSRHTVEPAAAATRGGAEIVFALDTPEAVDAAQADWSGRGLKILQAPTDMDFGRTFVALDPDNHRLRVYWLSDGQQADGEQE